MVIDPSGPVTDILDRQKERALLREVVVSGRDVLVYGPRRLGKTSLVQSVLATLPKEIVPFHVDCTLKETDEEVAQVLLSQLKGFTGRWARLKDWVQEHLEATSIRMVVTSKGGFTLEVDPTGRSGRSIPDAVDLIGKVAAKAKVRALVSFDEWQVPMKRNPAGFIWQMRAVSQANSSLQFLFNGSETRILETMLDSKNRAFYKGLAEFRIEGIGVDDVLPDLPKHGIQLSPEAIELLRDACGRTTLRLMEVLHRLEGKGKISVDAARDAVRWTANLHAADFERELGHAKPGPQRRVLLGMARDPKAQPTGHEFLRKHGLKTGPSAMSALRRLQQLDILDKDYQFEDALFRWYLANDPDITG